MDDNVVIALFRHGITKENKRYAYLGWNDSPLCPESLDVKTTRRYERYFSSDLRRCILTAEKLFSNPNLLLLEEIREMNFGKWEGKTYEDLRENGHYQRWLSDPINNDPPGGESFQQFTKRVQVGWKRVTEEILSQNIHQCAVITHGGVIRYLLSKYAPKQKEFWSWQVRHGQGFELIFDKEAIRRGKRCTLLLEVPLTEKEHG
jgi:alpha-ribazole phosphatase